MKYNYLLIGETIRNERLKNNYSIRGLARLVGMSDTELSRWENGERINYNLILLIRLCEILKINFINLLKVNNYLPVNYKEEVSNKEKFAESNYKNNNIDKSNYIRVYIPREFFVIGELNEKRK